LAYLILHDFLKTAADYGWFRSQFSFKY